MISILAAIVVLGILIFVHELGHFTFAKLFGVGVEKFSLGFGPKLVGWRKGETEYLISAFPLGGYVKMVGEGNDVEPAEEDKGRSEEDKERSFAEKPPLKRVAIVVAGPLSNILFAFLVYCVLFMIGVPFPTARIGEVLKDKPAARAGIQPNDVITEINGRPVKQWDDFAKVITEGKGEPVDLKLRRGAAILSFHLVPEVQNGKNLFGEPVTSPVIGVKSSTETYIERFGPLDALIKGGEQTWTYIRLTILSLVKIIERVVSPDNIGGPIMIAVISGQQAAAGAVSFFAFMALLSINLGVLNLLPIPVLDGGHLFFYIYELIFRKPLHMRTREIAQQIGLTLLVTLMFFATYNDIVRYWNDIMKFFLKFT
ncbi:MAG TPA: RIP metalloprotease RseP [Geobacteraceae bacterium]|nr:RIP metalloprotease RseP [Geobacteraceae bacterium]